MFALWKKLWKDESGAVITAEAGLLLTLGAAGVVIGLRSAAESVDAEFGEIAEAFRSLDQSYCYEGFCSPHAATAGSCYDQPPVEESLKRLRHRREELERDDDAEEGVSEGAVVRGGPEGMRRRPVFASGWHDRPMRRSRSPAALSSPNSE